MRPQPGFVPHIRTLGHGPRKALALHCTMAFSGAWAGLARVMGAGITLVAPDMPSHGASPDWDEESSFADTVFAASKSVLTEPMDVIGHSFGAATALRLGLEVPELVRSLTLFEPVFFHVAALDAPGSIADHEHHAAAYNAAFAEGNREGAARAFNRMWSPQGPRWPDLPEGLRAAMTRAVHVVPDTIPFLMDDSEDMMGRLSTMERPTLLLRGGDSLDIIRATNEGLARRLPNARDIELPGTGHMAPITHPGAVAEVWEEFLAKQVCAT